jgi:hypothetical protein
VEVQVALDASAGRSRRPRAASSRRRS